MEAFIVVLDVELTGDGRRDCEVLENHVFTSSDNVGHSNDLHVRDKVQDFLTSRDPEFNNDALAVYSLSDFMDVCNNSDSQVCEINLMGSWISYVYLD